MDTIPNQEALIVGAALVALHGYEREKIATLRAFQDPKWNEHAVVLECRNLMQRIRGREPIVRNDNDPMWDLLAHTQQTLRVPLGEWECILKIAATNPGCEQPQEKLA